MAFEEELFLEQYRQIWKQRRQHVRLYWAIPTVSVPVISLFFVGLDVKLLELTRCQSLFLIVFGVGVSMLFLRHNFFVGAYGRLLKKMQDNKQFLSDLPQSGRELRSFLRRSDLYDKMKLWEQWPSTSLFDGMLSWLIIVLGLTLFIVSVKRPQFCKTVLDLCCLF